MGSKRKQEKRDEKKEKKRSKKNAESTSSSVNKQSAISFDHRYIVAPMVGASELPFRLLCRKYGAQLVYTPMMIAEQFANSKEYREKEFQTTPFDRPLVCHFAANDPVSFANASQKAQPYCDAIDLNLGCPQRTAHVGHFGSYLLDKKDRELVISIVKAGVEAVDIPIFVKIRLLDTYEESEELCRELYKAGASLIAVRRVLYLPFFSGSVLLLHPIYFSPL
jgi:tRNA-dihydrouridine synthase 1